MLEPVDRRQSIVQMALWSLLLKGKHAPEGGSPGNSMSLCLPCNACQPVKPLCLLLQPPEAAGDGKDKKKGDKGAKGKKK